jgi:uncharacterized membrane protein YvbJ
MEVVICDKCGHDLQDESVFCNKCGHKLRYQTSLTEINKNYNSRDIVLQNLIYSLKRIAQKKDDESQRAYEKYLEGRSTKQETTTEIETPKQIVANKINKTAGSIFSIIGCLGLIIVFIVIVVSCNSISNNSHKDFKDITNKEMDDFLKWDQKEQQKKHDNEKFFKN